MLDVGWPSAVAKTMSELEVATADGRSAVSSGDIDGDGGIPDLDLSFGSTAPLGVEVVSWQWLRPVESIVGWETERCSSTPAGAIRLRR